MRHNPTTFDELIGTWGIALFAADIGVNYSTANAMKQRNSVPSEHWLRIVQLGEERGFALSSDALLIIQRNSKAAPPKPIRKRRRSEASPSEASAA